MKVNRIHITNFQRLAAVTIQPAAPIVLIAGRNEAGKSSLLDACRLALLGESSRVKLKKDWGAMMREGSKGGVIEFEAGEAGSATVDVKSWRRESNFAPRDDLAMHILLDPALFARMDSSQRRSTMFSVNGVAFNGNVVVTKMLERKANKAKVDTVSPMLRQGFPSAAEFAKTRATEAKGAWRAITQEVYGASKAETWEANTVEAPSKEKSEQLRNSIDNLQTEVADYTARLEVAEKYRQMLVKMKGAGALEKSADQIALLEESQKHLESRMKSWAAKIAEASGTDPVLTCPCCGKELALVNKALVLAPDAPAVSDEDVAYAKLQHSKGVKELLALEESLRDARKAKAELDAIKAIVDDPSYEQENIGILSTKRADLIEELNALRAELKTAEQAITANESAAKATRDAMKHHTDVKEWTAIADMLSPDGIPGELLSAALGPFNAKLQDASLITTWAQVTLTSEMEIMIGGRPYALCSESAKWRADAMIAYAIASITGIRFFALDRLDVLDVDGRATCLSWLHSLATNGDIDTVIALGTFKEAPRLPPEQFDTRWLDEGAVKTESAQAA